MYIFTSAKPGYRCGGYFDRYGFLVAPKNEVINRQVIERLKTFRVRQLLIYDSELKEKTKK